MTGSIGWTEVAPAAWVALGAFLSLGTQLLLDRRRRRHEEETRRLEDRRQTLALLTEELQPIQAEFAIWKLRRDATLHLRCCEPLDRDLARDTLRRHLEVRSLTNEIEDPVLDRLVGPVAEGHLQGLLAPNWSDVDLLLEALADDLAALPARLDALRAAARADFDGTLRPDPNLKPIRSLPRASSPTGRDDPEGVTSYN